MIHLKGIKVKHKQRLRSSRLAILNSTVQRLKYLSQKINELNGLFQIKTNGQVENMNTLPLNVNVGAFFPREKLIVNQRYILRVPNNDTQLILLWGLGSYVDRWLRWQVIDTEHVHPKLQFALHINSWVSISRQVDALYFMVTKLSSICS